MRPRLRQALAAVLALLPLLVSQDVATAAAPGRQLAPSATQVRAAQWWLSKLDITKAWSETRGKGVTVAVLDTGVNPSHPDLSGAVSGGKDFSGRGAANGQKAVGGDPHGTAMAGYIAGRGHGAGNAEGMIGVAPEATLLSVSTNTIGDGGASSADSGAAAGLRWAVDHGAKVVNMSFLSGGLTAADIGYAQAHDAVLVGATGNDRGMQVNPPSGFLGVVAVSGVDEDLATDSSATTGSPIILPSSPSPADAVGGVAVAGPYADRHSEGDGNTAADGMVGLTTSGYQRTAGTSNATAIVSGVVALIRAAHPELKAADVVNRLIQTARRMNPAGAGWSSSQGFGIPDAYRAITVDLPTVCENPLGSLAEPQSFGAWKAIKADTRYVPACTGSGGSSSAGPSTGASNGSQASPGESSSAVAGPASDTDSGVPVWVWFVVAAVVLALIGMLVLARRNRAQPAGHGPQAPGGYGAPGGYRPPPTGPPPNGPPGGYGPPPSGPPPSGPSGGGYYPS